MKIKTSLWVAAFVAVAAMAAAPMVQTPAHAAKISGKVKVKANGKRFSSFKRATTGTSTSFPAVFSVIANGKPSRKGIKTLTFSVNVDLATATLPVTLPAFTAVYSESSLTGINQAWGGEGMTVTIEKVKGNLVSGKFSGSLPPSIGATGPVSLEGGTFKIKLATPIGG